MKKYIKVRLDTLERMMESFEDEDVAHAFLLDFAEMIYEVNSLATIAAKHKDDPMKRSLVSTNMLVHLAIFCRSNIDVILEMVHALDYQVTDDKGGNEDTYDVEKELGIG